MIQKKNLFSSSSENLKEPHVLFIFVGVRKIKSLHHMLLGVEFVLKFPVDFLGIFLVFACRP